MPFLHWLEGGTIAVITQWTDKNSIEYEQEATSVDELIDEILTTAQEKLKVLEDTFGPFNKKTKPLLINFNSRKLFEADTQEDMALLKKF